jgi:hypothetical protein
MPLKNLTQIKPTNKSKVISGNASILEHIETHFGKVTNKQDLKTMPSFILFVCCLVEEAYSSKHNKENGKLNKKEEVLKLITTFVSMPLTEPEKKIISEIIEDLHSSNRIKKYLPYQIHFLWLSNFF